MTFISFAQNFEDVVLWRALNGVENGFYIDVGAWDPDRDSVTRAFSDRGWRGVNIEPLPDKHADLCRRRPRDVNLRAVVGDAPGTQIFFEVLQSGLSTTDPDLAARHAAEGFDIVPSTVDVTTLAEICRAHAPPEIHFLKVDCEGGERAALAGADFTLFRPWIVLVEATEPRTRTPNHESWEPILLEAGYRFVWFDELNRFYVAAEHHASLAPLLAQPPNCFDDFMRADEIRPGAAEPGSNPPESDARPDDGSVITPRIIHFIYAPRLPFGFIHDMAIRSALAVNPGYDVMVHCEQTPDGPYWDRLRPAVTVVERDGAATLRTRVEVLLRYGGIYLELDTICQKPFEPLRSASVVMGIEVDPVSEGDRIAGLCLGTILAPPGAPFLTALLEARNDAGLAGSPMERQALILAQALPSMAVQVEPPASFCWPAPDERGIDMLFFRDLDFPDSYCLRLWQDRSWAIVAGLDESRVAAHNTTYNRIARRYIDTPTRRTTGLSKLNLGCGTDRREGWVNVDRRWTVWPDVPLDIGQDAWPFGTDTIEEAELSHVLQYVGPGLRHAMTELYRVCRDDAKVSITVPHWSDRSFLIDPAVIRRFDAAFFYMFDRELDLRDMHHHTTRSAVAVEWEVDFVVESIDLDGDLVREALSRPEALHGATVAAALNGVKPYHFPERDAEIKVLFRVRKNSQTRDAITARFQSVDEAWYLASNPDVAEAVANGRLRSATEHYVWHGHDEHRLPRPIAVDEAFYFDRYPDVREAVAAGIFGSAQAHFDFVGYREGRLPAAPAKPNHNAR
jgi:FkbM family methyltransferase